LVTLVKELVTALVPHPQLLVQLICWLLRERLMEQCNGAELLQYCFTTMSYEASKV
jgi:pumilio RNA-binding family